MIVLALLTTFLIGVMVGGWLALEFVRRLRPGREGDLVAELAALRASAGLHEAALSAQQQLWQAAGDPDAKRP